MAWQWKAGGRRRSRETEGGGRRAHANHEQSRETRVQSEVNIYNQISYFLYHRDGGSAVTSDERLIIHSTHHRPVSYAKDVDLPVITLLVALLT